MNNKVRQLVLAKYGGHCAYCGKMISLKTMQIDHIVPLRRGDTNNDLDNLGISRGTDDISNYTPACRSCNFRKGTFSVEQFRNQLKQQCEGIIKRSFQVRQSMDYGLLEFHDIPVVFYFEKLEKEKVIKDRKEFIEKITRANDLNKICNITGWRIDESSFCISHDCKGNVILEGRAYDYRASSGYMPFMWNEKGEAYMKDPFSIWQVRTKSLDLKLDLS
jgi:hypothetical protein